MPATQKSAGPGETLTSKRRERERRVGQKTPLAKVGDGEAARSLQRALTERYAGTALVMS